MSPLGVVHLVFSFVAIGAGGVVLLLRKGTRWHRTLGHVYATSMVGLVATAFSLYQLTGSFGVFHVAAIVAGVTLAGGMWTVLMRKPRKQWIEAHATWMSWSYVGLIAAFVAESMTRFVMPRAASILETSQAWAVFWSTVAIGSFGAAGLGWWLIKTRLDAAVAATPAAMRQERQALDGREPPTPLPLPTTEG